MLWVVNTEQVVDVDIACGVLQHVPRVEETFSGLAFTDDV